MRTVDFELEKAAIRKAAAGQAAASNKGGIEGAIGYASYATEDATWLPPEAPAIHGREAIARYITIYTEMKDFQITWEHYHVVVSREGDMAHSVGTYKGSGKDPNGTTQIYEGKLVNVWQKQADGSWKIAVAMWNTNQPA